MESTRSLLPGVEVVTFDLGREVIDPEILSQDERGRRFCLPRHRRRYLAAHSALRRTLGAILDIAPGALTFETDGYGKPCVEGCCDLAFSLAHSDDVAVLAFSQNRAAIGIDVERTAPPPEADAMVKAFFSPREHAQFALLAKEGRCAMFARLWTAKEAVAKSAGGIRALSFAGFTVDTQRGLAHADASDDRRWSVVWFVPVAGYAGALAVPDVA